MTRSITTTTHPLVMDNLAGEARLYVQNEQVERASELVGLTLHHSATILATKEQEIEPLLSELGEKMPTDKLEAALEHGKSLNLDEVVQNLLDTFGEDSII